jgi:NADPH:quinone reductase-like Zn-dependent oxidoreductase
MMALRAHARGGPGRLVYEQAPVPSAGPGEVLIAVHAAAITFAELTWDLEWTTRDGKDRTPAIPAHEMSGVVAGLGVGVAGPEAGNGVIGLIDFDRDGAAAEYVVMPAASLAAKPPSVSHVAAATLPLAALTAWQALADHADLQPGEQVLVQGAPAESAYSPSSSRRSSAATSLSAPPDQDLAGRYKVHAMTFVVEQNPRELADLAEMAGAGRLRAVISQTFPLAQGQQAFESGRAALRPGKTVLVVR